MNTITFQGTEEELYNLQDVYEQCDKTKPKEVETLVYVVDGLEHNTKHLTDSMFITLVVGFGRVYTLPTFQDAFNNGYIDTFRDIIRIINVPV
jgi:hypothetical protein